MAKFRQPAQLRVASPRYSSTSNLSTGDAVIFDSSPIVSNAINIAERQRQNELYLNSIKEEQQKKREKDTLEYLDKVGKDIRDVKLIDGLNVGDSRIVSDRLKVAKEAAIKKMMDYAGADPLTRYKVRDDITNSLQAVGDEMMMRKNAYASRTSSIKAKEQELYPQSKLRILAMNDAEPTYDSKMNPVNITPYQTDLVGMNFNDMIKDIGNQQDVNIGTEGYGSGVYNKYVFNQDNAKKSVLQNFNQLLNTPQRDAALRTVANDLYNSGSKDVIAQKDDAGRIVSLTIDPKKADKAM